MRAKQNVSAQEHRRIARRIEALVVLVVLGAVLYVCTSNASAAYNHVDVCKNTLRGNPGDDDVHNWGVATGATSFGGWGGYAHYSDGSVYVWGYFNYSYGKVALAKGRCTDGDYSTDWFAWS